MLSSMNDLFLVIFPLTKSRASCSERSLRSTIPTVTIDKKTQVYMTCVSPLAEATYMYITLYSLHMYIGRHTGNHFSVAFLRSQDTFVCLAVSHFAHEMHFVDYDPGKSTYTIYFLFAF